MVGKKGAVTYFHAYSFQCYLSESFGLWVCILFIYNVSTSIICVSVEELTLIESNQQICDFYKWVIFKKQRHCGK